MAERTSFQYKMAPRATLEACDEVGIIKNPLPTDDYAALTAKIVASTSMSAVDVNASEAPDGRGKLVVNAKSNLDPQQETDKDVDDIAWFSRNTTESRFEFISDIVDKTITNGENDRVNCPQMVTYVGNLQTIVA